MLKRPIARERAACRVPCRPTAPHHGGRLQPGLLAARPFHGSTGLAWCAAGRPGGVAVDGCLDAPAAAAAWRRR